MYVFKPFDVWRGGRPRKLEINCATQQPEKCWVLIFWSCYSFRAGRVPNLCMVLELSPRFISKHSHKHSNIQSFKRHRCRGTRMVPLSCTKRRSATVCGELRNWLPEEGIPASEKNWTLESNSQRHTDGWQPNLTEEANWLGHVGHVIFKSTAMFKPQCVSSRCPEFWPPVGHHLWPRFIIISGQAGCDHSACKLPVGT